MKSALPLMLAIVLLPAGLQARDPSRVDASKQNTRLAPSGDNADTPLSPSRETNQRTFFRNEVLEERRFHVPEQMERKDAVLGDRRAPIDVTETRDKTIIDRKEAPMPEVRERTMYFRDGEKARIQPEGEWLKQYDKVSRFQNRMKDAETAASQRQPLLEKRTTFEKINRFIFKRNGPGTESGGPMVTPAGSSEPPPSQDTYVKYKVDWKRFDPPSR